MESYGVMALKFEFWLSAIIFIGGGALIWHDHSLESLVFMAFTAVITFWFTRRQQDNNSSNLINAMQQQPTPIAFTQQTQTTQNEQPTQPEQNAVQTQTNTKPFGG